MCNPGIPFNNKCVYTIMVFLSIINGYIFQYWNSFYNKWVYLYNTGIPFNNKWVYLYNARIPLNNKLVYLYNHGIPFIINVFIYTIL